MINNYITLTMLIEMSTTCANTILVKSQLTHCAAFIILFSPSSIFECKLPLEMVNDSLQNINKKN